MLLIVSVYLAVASSANADLATITVDIVKKTVSPENPTVNIAANDAVLIRIVADGKNMPSGAEVNTFLSGPRPLLQLQNHEFAYEGDYPSGEGPSPLIVFRNCDNRAKRDYPIRSSPTSPELESPSCPFYTLDSSRRTFAVVIEEGIILVRATARWQANDTKFAEDYAFAVQVVHREFALAYSAGFAFLAVRDHEYRLDPISGDDKNLRLVRNGDGGVPYQFAAFAHYSRFGKKTRSLSASFGVATKVPVNELTAMLGLTLSLHTLPIVNSGHFTVGLAYAPRQELIQDYRGRDTVPVGTAPTSLTSSRYAFGFFAAVTFSFLGGEEQFKGVYSGKPTSETK
jgi:hypothetical protein